MLVPGGGGEGTMMIAVSCSFWLGFGGGSCGGWEVSEEFRFLWGLGF